MFSSRKCFLIKLLKPISEIIKHEDLEMKEEQSITFKREILTLQGRLHLPEQDKFDLAILVYGFAGHMNNSPCKLLPDLARELWKKNIATLRFEFSGHGDSDGVIEDMNVFSQLLDANAALQYALHLNGVKHVFMIGHSQGGVVTSMIAGMYPDKLAKEVLINPAATLVDDAKVGTCYGVDYDPNHIPETLELPAFTLKDFYFRSAKFLNIYEYAKHFTGKALILAGENDEIVNNYASRHYHALLPDNEYYVLKGGNHNMDKTRQEVNELTVNFLSR